MAIKIDMEKTYDRLSWSFISDTLEEAMIPGILRRLIIKCLTSASMQVLWNGEFKKDFTPSGGVKQGDLISPYLFVLTMERLGHMIQGAVNDGR